MSYSAKLRHRMLVKHPDPASSPDVTGQPITDLTGQPVGVATIESRDPDASEWADAVEVACLVQERTAKFPDGPGAGSELVDTRIFFLADAAVSELDNGLRIDIDPPQAYQITFVNRMIGYGHPDHMEAIARRLPL